MNFLVKCVTHVKMNTMENQTVKLPSELQESASFQQHKQQRFWQILFPLIFGGLIILAVGVLMVLTISGVATGVNESQYADVAGIWIVLPLMFVAVIVVLILSAMIYGAARLLNILPGYTRLANYYVRLAAEKIQVWTKKAMEPIVKLESFNASLSAFFKGLSGRS